VVREFKKKKNGQIKNDEFLDPYPKIETMELKKVHPVLKQDDEALNFSTEIKVAIFKKTPLILEFAVILVNHQPFDEIPQPSQAKLSKSEPIFVNKLEIRRDMFYEYDWWVFKKRWKIEKLQETEVQFLSSFVFQYLIEDCLIFMWKTRWRWKNDLVCGLSGNGSGSEEKDSMGFWCGDVQKNFVVFKHRWRWKFSFWPFDPTIEEGTKRPCKGRVVFDKCDSDVKVQRCTSI
jgi:hypothetical protein